MANRDGTLKYYLYINAKMFTDHDTKLIKIEEKHKEHTNLPFTGKRDS